MLEKCIVDKLKTPHKISLYKNGNNSNIYYYFRWKNQRYQGSTGSDNIEISRNKVNEIFFEISKGLRKKGREKTVKFEDVVKKFIDYKEKQDLSPRTINDYKRQSKYLIERFKGRSLESLCSKTEYLDYGEWRRKYYLTHEKKRQIIYKRNGKVLKGRLLENVGNVPINRECRLLVNILHFSKEFLSLLQNVEIPSYKIFPEHRREEILTREEYLKLEEYWSKKNPFYWYIISFVNNTGIRYPSEMNRIVWADVHLDKSFILIRNRKNKNKSVPVNTPVPLVGRSKEIIEILKSRENISKEPNDKVFVNNNGIQIKNIRNGFKKSLRECGIDEKLTMYSLRHLFTTRMVRRPDIPIKILSEVLGHKDTTMINKYYSHLRTEDLVNVFQRSEDHKQEILNQQTKSPSKTTS